MANLKIEVEHRYLDYGQQLSEKLDADSCFIKVCDGDKVVAEASLESLVKKFLIVSSEYAQAMALLGLLKGKQGDRIVVAKNIPEEKGK
jgi:hypothetical protein